MSKEAKGAYNGTVDMGEDEHVPAAADPPGNAPSVTLPELFTYAAEKGASDLHLVADVRPIIRVDGTLQEVPEFPVLSAGDLELLITSILTPDQRRRFERTRELDFSYKTQYHRLRVNLHWEQGRIGLVSRVIPFHIPAMGDLGLGETEYRLTKLPHGLILVTGPTGHGKSTTLAAMIDDINIRVKGHILTIEDPIEFVHQRKSCLISQREIGVHSPSFASALHSALREDPDVILVGELRDLETMSIAVTAAEMGILVMGTLHTNGAAPTVDRMINVFPSDKQSHVRTMLSTSLRGVVSQQLLQKSDKQGRVAALEILVNTPASQNLIRQGKLDQLENVMQAGGANGMRTMDSAIQQLLDSRQITGKEAYKKGINKVRFEAVKDQG